MDARKFDAFAVATSSRSGRANRRTVLRGLAALAATALMPLSAKADGGVPAVSAPPSGLACTSGLDCAPGEICLNGACAPRSAVGGTAQDSSGTSGTATTIQTGATGQEVPQTVPVTPPTDTTSSGVGGLIQPGEPLPARIYTGRCGALGADAAFQLIDVGSVEGLEADENPQGALTAIPAEFSTTVVNASLATLLESEHAIEIRVNDSDPATAIACGDIGGPLEAGADGNELAVGLQERGQSAYSGIAWLQDAGDRTLVRVFLARGLGEGVPLSTAQTAAVETTEPTTATTTDAPAATAAQTAATPAAITPLGAGSTVVTTIDVNLRAEPSNDATVLTILGEGVELDVTGSPADGWVPVVDPASGQAGFVSDQFVAIAS